MVKVCDAIMGSGKTSATIDYINSHPEKKFLYITPYLPEASRIKDNCPDANFVEPSKKLPQYDFSKSTHTLALIAEGRNIASTHRAVMYYTEDTIRELKEKNYTVIIDEEVNVLQRDTSIAPGDIRLAIDAGYIKEVTKDEYELTPKAKDYDGGRFSHMFRLMASRNLICIHKGNSMGVYHWIFPKRLLSELDDVIVLTYLFERSEMQMYLNIHNIPYSYIGISRTDSGGYRFSDHKDYVPEYVNHLSEMILIETNEKMNRIGDAKTALSMNWYKTNDNLVDQLRKNIANYFINRVGGTNVNDRMCGTYKDYWGKIRGKGYWNSHVVFTSKATNEFRNRSVLVYPVNLFAGGEIVRFYAERGETFDNDRYSLSIMVQWIWRSAIRDGKKIHLYIPSKRMRTLLTEWIKNINTGGTNVA